MLSADKIQLKGYLFWSVILGMIILAVLIALPFVIAILSAYLLAYMARPLFLKLAPIFKPSLAAAGCVVVVIILVIVPMLVVVMGIINQTGDALSKQSISHYIVLVATHPLLRGFNLNSITLQTQFNQLVSDTIASVLRSLPDLAWEWLRGRKP